MRHPQSLLTLSLALAFLIGAAPAGSAKNEKPIILHHPQGHPVLEVAGPVSITHATWYGPGFFGKVLKSGRRYAKGAVFVAHRSYPIGTMIKVTNLRNHLSIIVPVEDRGPYADPKRGLDFSYAAAMQLGMVSEGVARVAYAEVAIQPVTQSPQGGRS